MDIPLTATMEVTTITATADTELAGKITVRTTGTQTTRRGRTRGRTRGPEKNKKQQEQVWRVRKRLLLRINLKKLKREGKKGRKRKTRTRS